MDLLKLKYRINNFLLENQDRLQSPYQFLKFHNIEFKCFSTISDYVVENSESFVISVDLTIEVHLNDSPVVYDTLKHSFFSVDLLTDDLIYLAYIYKISYKYNFSNNFLS